MRLKLFRAANMAQAMAQVRSDLGPDAMILQARRVPDGVELSAAVEQDGLMQGGAGPAPIQALPPAELLDPLAHHGVPAALAGKLRARPLAAGLEAHLSFAALPTEAGAPPLVVAGPPGAGKTLTVARLATRLVLAGRSPLVITADGRRAGATEQLAAFTRLLGVNLMVATQPATLGRALERREADAPVLIDMPGTDPFDPGQRDDLAGLATAAAAAIALVLPGGVDAAESADLAVGFADLGARLLIATRLDLARRIGGILAAAEAGGLALTEAGTGPGAADGLVPMTPTFLAARLGQVTQPERRAAAGAER